MNVKTRVLLVESMTDLREVLEDLLEQAGYEVRSAATALAALEECERFRPHVALVDTTIADAHASRLANHLRASMEPRSLVLAMSLEPITGWPAAAYDRIHMKPITGPELRESIEGFLTEPRELQSEFELDRPSAEDWLSRPN